MSLTPAQGATLLAYINSIPELAQQPLNSDGAFAIAEALNAVAAPEFWVYRTDVSNDDLGDAMNGGEIASMSSLNMQRLQVLAAYSRGFQNMARPDRRTAFNQVFSGAGGQLTRAAMEVLWRRRATVFEKLFATGTGSTASPATMAVEGTIAFSVIQQLRGE